MDQTNKWVFIINPIAGNGYALSLEGKIREMISRHDLPAEVVFTERRGHATELSQYYADRGYKYIIAVGGDGTMNEIASPLFTGKTSFLAWLAPARGMILSRSQVSLDGLKTATGMHSSGQRPP